MRWPALLALALPALTACAQDVLELGAQPTPTQHEDAGGVPRPVDAAAIDAAASIDAAAIDAGTLDAGPPPVTGLPDYQPCGEVGVAQIEQAVPSPDGATIALATRARELVLVAASDGRVLRRVAAHQGAVEDVAFSDDGATLVTWGTDGILRAWRTADGAPLWEVRPRFRPRRSRVAIRGDEVALGGPPVEVFDLSSGALRLGFEHPTSAGVSGFDRGLVAFSPDGTRVYAGRGGEVRAYDRSGQPVGAAFSGDLGTIATDAYAPDIQSLELSADGSALLVAVRRAYFASQAASYPVARLYRTADAEVIATLSGPSSYGVWAALAPDGDHLAISSGSAVAWWTVRDEHGWLGARSTAIATPIRSGELHIDARGRVLSRFANILVALHDPRAAEPALEILAGAPDEGVLAIRAHDLVRTAGDGSRVELWSRDAAPQRLRSLEGSLRIADLSADGRWLAVSSTRGVELRSLDADVPPVRVSTIAVSALSLAPDGASFLSADRPRSGPSTLSRRAIDGTLLERRASSIVVAQIRRAMAGEAWVTVGPSRDHFIGPNGAEAWATRGPLTPLGALRHEVTGADAADLASDGARLAAAGWVTPVVVLELPSGVGRALDDQPRAARLAFTPDGRALILGGPAGALAVAPADRPEDQRALFGDCRAADCPTMAGDVARLVLSPDGHQLVVVSSLGETRLYCAP